MITNQTIKDDVYMEIDDEFEQIRTALGMYISKIGTEGALHLTHEIVNNEFDECANPEALDTKFDVIFDELEQSFSTMDYSRGIPFEKLVDVCTKKHTSTKFIRDDAKMKEQSGRNGVGLVVTAACSSYFAMTSYRGDQEKTVEIIDGKIKDHKPKKLKKPQHGLMVKVIPSEKYLKGKVYIKPDMIQEYLRKMSYVMKDDIVINYYEFARDISEKDYAKRKPSSHIVYKRLGLAENVRFLSQNIEFPPVEISTVSEDYDLEVAFSYDKTIDDTIVNSYCNFICTTEGGHHETVTQRAICDFFSREARNLEPNSKYEVSYDDCKKGLIYVVNCKHKDPAYEGQHKSRVSNADVLATGKRYLLKELTHYFNTNPNLLKKIVAYLRTIAKVRLESYKIKGIKNKKVRTFAEDNEIPMFYPLADRNSQGYSELIIAEGDSAANAIDGARNSKYQAVYGVMGVVNNVQGETIEKVISSSRVFRNLVIILGCGYGKTFDITKLRYNKIIIEADADADGNNITSLVLLFFVMHMPELIFQGKIYKALPPLLILDEKSLRRWYKGPSVVFSRQAYYEVINQVIADNSDIAIESRNGKEVTPLKKKMYRKWLQANSEYISELNHLEARAACNPLILEYVCYANVISNGNQKKFKKLVESYFPEITCDLANNSLIGAYNGEDIQLVIDRVFWRGAQKFTKVMMTHNDSIFIHVKNHFDKTDDYERYTIGDFLYQMDRAFTIRIDHRYKGIGEMKARVIFDTTLNPKVRKLIRFTMDDVDGALSTFELLHADSKKMRQARRQLLKDSPISYMDLDN